MEIALVAGRLILALVFLVAGLAKLADLAGSRKSLIDFGVPAVLSAPLGFMLPVGELVVGVAVIPSLTAWWGAAGALALLLIFVAGISVNLARGRTPDCHCFGQLHSSPAGWKTLVRNIILSAVAAFIILQGGAPQPALLGWTRLFSRAQLALLSGGSAIMALLALNLWLWLQMLRQNGRLLLRIEALEKKLEMDATPAPPAGLPVGAAAPEFSLSGPDGAEGSLRALCGGGKPVLLFFTDPDCGPCNELLPEIAGWRQIHAGKMAIALISRGDADKNRSSMAKFGLKGVLLQKDREVAEAYQCSGTPGAVIVGADGRIASFLAMGSEAIRSLVAQFTRPEPARVGESAPDLRLPDLDGKTIDLRDLHGNRTMVLFWNPGCGFCRQMLGDVKAWEGKPSEDGTALLIVSSGTAEENRAQGFRSPVALEKDFNAGYSFGATGTPSAVLVDADGKIESRAAVGVNKVLHLMKTTAFRLTSR